MVVAADPQQEPASGSLSDLLKLLLGLPGDAPVSATRSFGSWLDPNAAIPWPPRGGSVGGLWLIDTRDRAARRHASFWSGAGVPAAGQFDAAIILSGSGVPGAPLRQLLRRIRHPGTRRLPEQVVSARFSDARLGAIRRLSFDDGLEIPSAFQLNGKPASTGAGFLLTKEPAFRGPLWSRMADFLGSATIDIDSFQLRVRGAAVVMVRAGGRRFVVRVVPPGGIQDVIARNHFALIQTRESLAGTDLRELMPAPVFSERDGSALVLGETMMPGTLAWKVASGALASVVHRNAVHFLDTLGAATAKPTRLGAARIAELLHEDRALLESSKFVSAEIQTLLRQEVLDATQGLDGADVLLSASHGDFGYGNILVNEDTGELEGVIDWDTARGQDFPGIDRINLEVQSRRSVQRESFASAVESVWRLRTAHEALRRGSGESSIRALFGLAVCRYIIRSFSYPAIYAREAAGFERALRWLSRTGR